MSSIATVLQDFQRLRAGVVPGIVFTKFIGSVHLTDGKAKAVVTPQGSPAAFFVRVRVK